MRDEQGFMVALEEHSLELHRLFGIWLREFEIHSDIKNIAKELTKKTIIWVFKYCKNRNYRDKGNIETLLLIKADAVWNEYYADYNAKMIEEFQDITKKSIEELPPHQKSFFLNQRKFLRYKTARNRENVIALRIKGYTNDDISNILNI